MTAMDRRAFLETGAGLLVVGVTWRAALIFTAMCAAAWLAVSLDAQSAVREAFADLPGVRLFYRDTGGNGAPVVFVHAATGNSRAWEYQLPAFTAAGYRVVAYDRRGFGHSVIDPAGRSRGPRRTICWAS